MGVLGVGVALGFELGHPKPDLLVLVPAVFQVFGELSPGEGFLPELGGQAEGRQNPLRQPPDPAPGSPFPHQTVPHSPPRRG